MPRLGTIRSFAIVLLIAAAVQFIPGGTRAANIFGALLEVLFAAGIGYVAMRLYRERRLSLYGLGRHRGLLYGAVALGAVTVAAQPRMWQTGFGEFAWFVLIGLVVYSLLEVYRFSRLY